MMRTVLGVAVLAFGTTTLVAQTDPIAARKALMKANGDQNRIATEMLEGKRPFSLDEAKKTFVVFAEAAEKAPALFPDNSKTGGDTAALPPIWENKADFNAKLAKFASEAKAAGEATKDLDTFKVQITEVRRIAAVATRPTASGRHKHLRLPMIGGGRLATVRPLF